MAKLEFPKYSGDDPTKWFNRVAQFFEFQSTTENQKVSLASFHLEGEANQWWQWLQCAYEEEGRLVTWESFEEELWLISDQLSVWILMKLCPKFDKSDPFVIIKKSSRGWVIGFMVGRKRHL